MIRQTSPTLKKKNKKKKYKRHTWGSFYIKAVQLVPAARRNKDGRKIIGSRSSKGPCRVIFGVFLDAAFIHVTRAFKWGFDVEINIINTWRARYITPWRRSIPLVKFRFLAIPRKHGKPRLFYLRFGSISACLTNKY